LDDVKFYCRALTPAQINTMYLPVDKIEATTALAINIYPNPVM
jgi:hypothetical protein